MGNLESTIPKQILKKKTIKKIKKKKPSTSIIILRKNKNPWERERERVLTVFLRGKYGLNGRNHIEFIQNQMGRRRVKHKKMKMVKEV